ncbi:hypothetical protein KC19_N022300 [Ceratodon purpureus]|nr:hypothetical protein KC19_N022300 [Ceratodon purpureus]
MSVLPNISLLFLADLIFPLLRRRPWPAQRVLAWICRECDPHERRTSAHCLMLRRCIHHPPFSRLCDICQKHLNVHFLS